MSEPEMMVECCAVCRFCQYETYQGVAWISVTSAGTETFETYRCRRGPPRHLTTDGIYVHGLVYGNGWCGEFKRKEKV